MWIIILFEYGEGLVIIELATGDIRLAVSAGLVELGLIRYEGSSKSSESYELVQSIAYV